MSIASHPSETPAAGASRLLVHLGLIILMAALPSLSILARGAIYVLMPVGAVIVLIGAAIGAPDHGPRQLRTALASGAGMTALFLVFWAALSLAWTPFPAEAAQRLAQIVSTTFLVALVASYLPERTRAFDLYLLPAGVALAAAILLFLAVRGDPAYFVGEPPDGSLFERAMLGLIVLVWPALGALCLRERWGLAAALAVLAAGVAFAGFAQAALAAMGTGAFVFAMAMSNHGRLARVLGVGAAALILLAPLLPLAFGAIADGRNPGPGAETMLIWRQSIVSEWPRLLTGHGFDATNRTLALGLAPELTPRSLLFLVWHDLGVIGAAAFALLTAKLFFLMERTPETVAPAALAGLCAILTLAALGAAAAQIWWITLIDCAVIAYVLLIKAVHRTERPAAPAPDEDEADFAVVDLNAEPARGL